MEVFTERRLLCLGNDLLADDAFGIRVAEEARRRFDGDLDVVATSGAGFDLLDHLVGVTRLVLVDTAMTGRVKPGTIRIWSDGDVRPAPGCSPHFAGVFEVLSAARALGLDVPSTVTIITVEAADCTTVGGRMHPDVDSAIQAVVDLVAP